MIAFFDNTDFHYAMQATDLQGAAIDLTGATTTCTVYPDPREGAAATATFTVANSGITINEAVTGKFTVDFEPGDLATGEYTLEATAVLANADVVFLGRTFIKVLNSEFL